MNKQIPSPKYYSVESTENYSYKIFRIKVAFVKQK